jgi:hypothetical protein
VLETYARRRNLRGPVISAARLERALSQLASDMSLTREIVERLDPQRSRYGGAVGGVELVGSPAARAGGGSLCFWREIAGRWLRGLLSGRRRVLTGQASQYGAAVQTDGGAFFRF